MPKESKHTDSKSKSFAFYITVFVSAFLLFQVQPLIGKYILPWFGGGSSVWTSTVLFFEILLLFGYGYAYGVTRFSLKKQTYIHVGLLAVVSFLLLLLFFLWRSPITPPLALRPPDFLTPVVQVLLVLGISVGLPYFLLSTTSSLLQRWFSLANPGKSPYMLYSLSNAGSLLGLITYPFLIEVFLPLQVQGRMWAVGFFLFAVFLIVSARAVMARNKDTAVHAKVTHVESVKETISLRHKLLWIFLPMVSSMILISTTSQLTQSVAPAPFLWILPLGLYLLSFVLIFSSKELYWRFFYPIAFLILAPLTIYISLDLQSFITNLVTYTAFIFVSYMLLHGELYLSRPSVKNLNLFYFLEALGSVIGGVFVALIAPLIFHDFWEFYIAAFLTVWVAIYVLLHKRPLFPSLLSRIPGMGYSFVLSIAIAICIASAGFYWIFSYREYYLAATRNFYGLVSVVEEYDENDNLFVKMYNGRISHGGQYPEGNLRYAPITYFDHTSGIGYGFLNHQERMQNNPLRIAVTGLGVGTVASYGRTGDTIDFFEINPNAIRLAEDYFTYLSDSKAKISVTQGDARIAMQHIQKNVPDYDFIILDAFVDDAIPMHLITKEAVDMYLTMLDKKNGVLAINISNRYLDLGPTIAKLAQALGMGYVVIDSDDGDNNVASASWALLSYNKDFFKNTSNYGVRDITQGEIDSTRLWTDDYSNLYQALVLE